MTYFEILILFIIPPLLILMAYVPRDLWRRFWRGSGQVDWLSYGVLLGHVALALIYTTPWDNYLVATGVWWYNPELVAGLTLGYVPIEEYTFFVLQTLLTGLWLIFLQRSAFPSKPSVQNRPKLRTAIVIILSLLWLASTALLASGWKPGTYLTLIISWALIPLIAQAVFGADILLANWKLIAAVVLPPTLYLWLLDWFALGWGTWVIDPQQTTGLGLGHIPIEEMLFFFVTNLIIGCGMTLMLSPAAQARARDWAKWLFSKCDGIARGAYQVALALWVTMLIATPISVWVFGEDVFPLLASLGVLAQLGATLAALFSQWDLRQVTRAALIVIVLSFLIEFVGANYGIPFGKYSYTSALQPQLLNVPFLIPLAWLMMLPPSWAIAEAILRRRRLSLGRFYWLAYAILAGAAMTAWDLYLDPQMVARELWTWNHPGFYYGIPLGNFIGWWLAALVITLAVRPAPLPRSKLLWIYYLTWLFQAVGLGVFWDQPEPALTGFIGMGVLSLIAWTQESKG